MTSTTAIATWTALLANNKPSAASTMSGAAVQNNTASPIGSLPVLR